MKVRVLALVFAVVILFCGCQPASVENTVPVKYVDVIIENGEYFVKIYQGKLLGSYDLRGLNYGSVDQIKTAIKTNSFSSGAINFMYNTFAGDRTTLPAIFPIIDPDKIVIPVFNGETDYFRVGFLNRTLMADMMITFNGTEYKLCFDTYYMGLEVQNNAEKKFAKALQAGNYKEHLQYSEDGINKQALVYTNGCKKIQYETAIEGIKYYVYYELEGDKIDDVGFEIVGTVENIGSFHLRITNMSDKYIEKAALQWIMESIELKKA